MYVIYYFTGFKYNIVFKRTLLILIFTGIMAISVTFALWIASFVLDGTNRLQSLPLIVIGVVVGAFVYFALAMKSKLAHRLFGTRIQKIQKKLGL